jgi:hypothetical protein
MNEKLPLKLLTKFTGQPREHNDFATCTEFAKEGGMNILTKSNDKLHENGAWAEN